MSFVVVNVFDLTALSTPGSARARLNIVALTCHAVLAVMVESGYRCFAKREIRLHE